MEATVIVTKAVPMPTPVNEKSSVKENCFNDCPNRSESRIEKNTINAKTTTAQNTLTHFTL